jgi:hypothetical protein
MISPSRTDIISPGIPKSFRPPFRFEIARGPALSSTSFLVASTRLLVNLFELVSLVFAAYFRR